VPTEVVKDACPHPLLVSMGHLLLRIQSRGEYWRGGIEKSNPKKIAAEDLVKWRLILLLNKSPSDRLLELSSDSSMGRGGQLRGEREFWHTPPC